MDSGGTGLGGRVEDLLALATAALGRGDWAGARDAYQQALAVGETAATLEGLAHACWWLRDDVTTIDSHRKAFRLYLEAGDQLSAARVAISLARDHILQGERSIANGWVARAERLLADAGPSGESAWLWIIKAHIALYADRDPPRARRQAQNAVAIGHAIGNRDVEMLALAYEGLALVSDGLVAEGMSKLDESSTAAISGELRGVDEAGTIACCLIAACERVRDVGRAAEWCQRLRELSERWAFELMIAVCRTHYASTLVARGQWQEAEREFQAAIAGFGQPHRGQAADAQVRLADLLVRQGRLDEATELLDRVDAGPGRMLGHMIALTVRAALLLEGGDAQGAADTAETFLRAMPGPESLERAPALEILVQANIALGDEQAARAALAGLRTLTDLVRTEPMLAAARFAQGAVAHAFADPAAARVALLDAVALFTEVDAPYERAQALLLLARCLAGTERAAAASAQAAEALRIAQVLGARPVVRQARDLLAELGTSPASAAATFAGLTSREAEILRLIARGSGNHDIAAQLVISVRTVERHVSNIYLKLGLEGPAARASAATAALRHGLV
jgi:LuxR family transcriptional regulator, maltose regulon positive regulatory protein